MSRGARPQLPELEHVVHFDLAADDERRAQTLPRPGKYQLRVRVGESGTARASVRINVLGPSPSTAAALEVMKRREDWAFLDGQIAGDQTARARLETVVSQCQDSPIASYAAARSGVAAYLDLFRLYNNKGGLVFREVYDRLRRGVDLPGDYPLREEALSYLACAEALAGDFDDADRDAQRVESEHGGGPVATRMAKLQSEVASRRPAALEVIQDCP